MQGKPNKVVVLQQYGKPLTIKEVPIPKFQYSSFLVKVQASTINFMDRQLLQTKFQEPINAGSEGVGQIVQVDGQLHKNWLGKKVTFIARRGVWANYALVQRQDDMFEITNDVPLSSAASGYLNPLTVLGIIETYKGVHGTGLVHTTAGSLLGRMLNQFCQRHHIQLLNIVRNEEQAELLKKQGAKYVIATSRPGWEKQLHELSEKLGFNVVFDALGGGNVTNAVVKNIKSNSHYYVYRILQRKGEPNILQNPSEQVNGIKFDEFNVFVWWSKASKQVQEPIRKQYSKYLINQFNTPVLKQFPFSQIQQAFELSKNKGNGGKVIVRMQ